MQKIRAKKYKSRTRGRVTLLAPMEALFSVRMWARSEPLLLVSLPVDQSMKLMGAILKQANYRCSLRVGYDNLRLGDLYIAPRGSLN